MGALFETSSADLVHLLSHPKRRAILQLLMHRPATLTQIGEQLGHSAAHIRHHLLPLYKSGLLRLVGKRKVRGFHEKYYAATARAVRLHLLLLPHQGREQVAILVSSNDPLLHRSLQLMDKGREASHILLLKGDSIASLTALRQGLSRVAGCHLPQVDGGFNQAYVQHWFPDRRMALLPFAHREVGLLHARSATARVPPSLDSLLDPGLRFINREAGSGVRIWLDQQVTRLGIPPDSIRGFNQAVGNHELLAERLQAGEADLGIGLAAVAAAAGLAFTPLYEERYDLVLPWELLIDPGFQPLREWLQGEEHRGLLGQMGGYRPAESSEPIPIEQAAN